jgi:hypothetical protein
MLGRRTCFDSRPSVRSFADPRRTMVRYRASTIACPLQDTHGSQRVPAAGEAVRSFHLEVARTLVRVLQGPSAGGIALAFDQVDGLIAPMVEGGTNNQPRVG